MDFFCFYPEESVISKNVKTNKMIIKIGEYMSRKDDSKKFVNFSFFVISLFMAAIALILTIGDLDSIIDSEIFLGIAIIFIALGLLNK